MLYQTFDHVHNELAIIGTEWRKKFMEPPRLVIQAWTDLSQQLCRSALKDRRELKEPGDIRNHYATLNT